jgi:hypothetical protein
MIKKINILINKYLMINKKAIEIIYKKVNLMMMNKIKRKNNNNKQVFF